MTTFTTTSCKLLYPCADQQLSALSLASKLLWLLRGVPQVDTAPLCGENSSQHAMCFRI